MNEGGNVGWTDVIERLDGVVDRDGDADADAKETSMVIVGFVPVVVVVAGGSVVINVATVVVVVVVALPLMSIQPTKKNKEQKIIFANGQHCSNIPITAVDVAVPRVRFKLAFVGFVSIFFGCKISERSLASTASR